MTIECSQSVHSIVFTCPRRGGSPAKQAQGRQCVLANKNCPGTLFPNRTIYLFYRTQHRWAVFSSGSRCCRFQFMAIEGSHSYLCRRRHKVAMIAEPNWTFASRFLRRKAPAEWRIYKKKQPHREGFVPDTAVLISVYYVRSDSAAPAQIMATPAFDCGVCSDT